MNKEQYLEKTKDYFAGGFSMVDDNASDGAWFQMHVDTAEWLLKESKEALDIEPPKGLDGHDVVMYYLQDKEQ